MLWCSLRISLVVVALLISTRTSASAEPCSAVGLPGAVFYVNGVITGFEDAQRSQRDLKAQVEADLGCSLPVLLNYNRSFNGLSDLYEAAVQKFNLPDDGDRVFWLVIDGAIDVARLEYGELAERLAEFVVDEGATLLLNYRGVPSTPMEEDIRLHYDTMNPILSVGKQVAIVGHSQGNFFANLEYEGLVARYPQLIPRMGVVSIATPDVKVGGDPSGARHSKFRGDPVVRALGLSWNLPVSGDESGFMSPECARIANPLYLHCHSFATYLGEPIGRAKVLADIRAVLEAGRLEAVDDRYPLTQGHSLLVSGILSNDSNPNDLATTVEYVAPLPQGFEVRDLDDGGFVYTPSPSFTGTVTIHYRFVTSAGRSNEATVSIQVSATAPPPPPTPDFFGTVGTPLSTGEIAPTRLAISPSGQFVFAQLGASIGVYSAGSDGSLSPIAGSPFTMPGANLRMAPDPLGRFLFVTDTTTDAISVFSVEVSGALSEVPGSPFLAGPNPQALAVSADGQRVFAGNFGDAVTPQMSISVFDVASSGALIPVTGSPFAVQLPTADSMDLAVHPILPFLIATGDLSTPGNDVSVFAISEFGALSPVVGSPFRSGSQQGGLRNVAISADGKFVFLVNARDLFPNPLPPCILASPCLIDTLGVMRLSESGALTHVPGSPFAIPNVDPTQSRIAISPDGTLVFTPYTFESAGATAVAVHRVGTTGAVTAHPGSPFSAGIPRARGLAVSPSGHFLYVADSANRTISVFSILPSQSEIVLSIERVSDTEGILTGTGALLSSCDASVGTQRSCHILVLEDPFDTDPIPSANGNALGLGNGLAAGSVGFDFAWTAGSALQMTNPPGPALYIGNAAGTPLPSGGAISGAMRLMLTDSQFADVGATGRIYWGTNGSEVLVPIGRWVMKAGIQQQ